ncbi:MAG TPA: metalloregulator ArsR/SmtB family transcription factor [Candidatus Limnocylindria bacterium]|jgi:DNA-binding transcriptional ArsR family regulator|nr:metalloregulator ArsR/SmtB family transcription factor [Candidatus Limnocylindria bacterium]
MQPDVFSALADPTRRQLVSWLAVRPSTATELARRLPISRQAVAKHLDVLDEARLIARERSGRDVRYSLDAERLARASEWLAAVSARWEARLQRLKRYVEEGERHA